VHVGAAVCCSWSCCICQVPSADWRPPHTIQIVLQTLLLRRLPLLLLLLPLQGAPSSKGCGLVAFATQQAAAAAIDILCNKYIWAGMRSPMVVKHITSQPDKPYDLGSSSSGAGGYPYTSSRGSSSRGFVRQYDISGGFGRDSRMYVPGQQQQPLPAAAAGTARLPHQDVLPRGCAPDAYKLFVGNIPKTCTERELRQVRQGPNLAAVHAMRSAGNNQLPNVVFVVCMSDMCACSAQATTSRKSAVCSCRCLCASATADGLPALQLAITMLLGAQVGCLAWVQKHPVY
jgi:hypothetical protein